MTQVPGLPGVVLRDERLKVLAHLNPHRSENFGVIVYAVLGDQVVYTQVNKDTVSSINLGEQIILAIAQSNDLDPKAHHFFDLMTNLAYGAEWDEEGLFQYCKVEIKGWRGDWPILEAGCWVPVVCPKEIIDLFVQFIGPNPRQKTGF